MKQALPKGWQEIYFDNEEYIKIIDGDRGINYPKQKEFFDNGYCLFLNTKNVTKYGFNFDDTKYITKEKDEKLRSGKLKKYDIVMTTRGTIGNIAFYNDKVDFENIRINSGMIIFRILSDKIFNKYLYIFLSSSIIKKQISNYISGMAQPQLPISSIHKLYFILPPLDEQKRIAEILSLCDEVIENLTELIEKKELYKKGVMQRLLSGEVRFNGFNDEWQTVRLGDIALFETGTSKAKYIDSNGKYIIIDMGAVSEKGKIIANKKTNFNGGFIKKYSLIMPKDDIGNGKIIGKTAVIENDNLYVLGDHVFQLTIKNNNPYFISYCINSYNNNKQIRRLCAGSMQIGLSKKSIENVRIKVPSLEEQKKIAELISVIDEEIENLKKQLELRKQQKKGLMQKLLTGEVRV